MCVGGVVSGALGNVRLVVEDKDSFVTVSYGYSEDREIGDANPSVDLPELGSRPPGLRADSFSCVMISAGSETVGVGAHAGNMAALFA